MIFTTFCLDTALPSFCDITVKAFVYIAISVTAWYFLVPKKIRF